MRFRRKRRISIPVSGILAIVGALFSNPALAAPKAEHVSPQRLTVFVGAGEHRVRIEGKNLREVDEVTAVDASQTGFVFEVPEVEARILHAEDDVMIVLLTAESHPERDDYLQLELRFVHQKYMVPAGLFQFNVE